MPRGRQDLAGSLLLVAVAVAGLLSMHGFDGAVASLSEPSHVAQPSTAVHGTRHDALGTCVFVLAVAGLGMAILGSSPRSRVKGRYPWTANMEHGTPVPSTGGRSRLSLLCVLRL